MSNSKVCEQAFYKAAEEKGFVYVRIRQYIVHVYDRWLNTDKESSMTDDDAVYVTRLYLLWTDYMLAKLGEQSGSPLVKAIIEFLKEQKEFIVSTTETQESKVSRIHFVWPQFYQVYRYEEDNAFKLGRIAFNILKNLGDNETKLCDKMNVESTDSFFNYIGYDDEHEKQQQQ